MKTTAGPLSDERPDHGKPFISVVTVSLNAQSSIEDTIASVSMQETCFNVQHICVDGGSVDSTRSIIDRWAAHSNSLVRIYEPDTGIFDAMNKGLRAADGEYVLFLNADDFLVGPEILAKTVSGLAPGAADNPDLIVGNVSMGELGSWGFWRHRNVPRLLGKLRGWGLYPLHQGQLTKCCLLRATGGFNSTLRLSSDVIQYYDLERDHRLSIRYLRSDVAFMRDGGAVNAGWKARSRATAEFYKHLSSIHSPVRASAMVVVKTLQSLMEVRLGRCPHARWFAPAIESRKVVE